MIFRFSVRILWHNNSPQTNLSRIRNNLHHAAHLQNVTDRGPVYCVIELWLVRRSYVVELVLTAKVGYGPVAMASGLVSLFAAFGQRRRAWAAKAEVGLHAEALSPRTNTELQIRLVPFPTWQRRRKS